MAVWGLLRGRSQIKVQTFEVENSEKTIITTYPSHDPALTHNYVIFKSRLSTNQPCSQLHRKPVSNLMTLTLPFSPQLPSLTNTSPVERSSQLFLFSAPCPPQALRPSCPRCIQTLAFILNAAKVSVPIMK